MIRTLLVGQEYVTSARNAGLYAALLGYIAKVQAGERPQPLPGEMPSQPQLNMIPPLPQAPSSQALSMRQPQQQLQSPSSHITKGRRSEKALTYFQNCLAVLGLEEEVALTDESLKKAYKRAAVRAHPDKGGTEEEFEAITRAHAYLGEILRHIKGGRTKLMKVDAPEALKDVRSGEQKQWEHIEPVRLNPKKLDLNAFNAMFEQTRIPDPEEEGYGDWLKTADGGSSGKNFGGKFNRDVFNKAFEDDARQRGPGGQELSVLQPQALTLAPTYGTELGRGRPDTYTAAPNASMKYTDLKSAYTTENTITNQVAGVNVDARSYESYSANRKKAPEPLRAAELESIQAAEQAMASREKQRQIRAAQEDVMASQYFERMKQLVLTNK